MKEDAAELPWLHLYAQSAWHDPATIVGTPSALKALRDAIDKCLATGMDARAEAIAADGEGYTIEIGARSLDWLEKERLPYTHPIAAGIMQGDEASTGGGGD